MIMHKEKTGILEVILTRRSIREFKAEPIPREALASILEVGRWAPSGLNNQPWRFAVIEDEQMLFKLAYLTKYSSIILQAPAALAVFLDKEASYSRDKDILAIGACIQNMLLQIHALDLGACWMGEILNHSKEVESLLKVPASFELLAVVAIGYPKEEEKKGAKSDRKDLKELVFGHWPFD
jgi:nitroreductase